MNSYEITVLGLVQGVGYRSFVADYAYKNNIKGYVKNYGGAVKIYVDCPPEEVGKFAYHLRYSCPSGSVIDSVKVKPIKNEMPAMTEEEQERGDTLEELKEKYGVNHEDEVLLASQIGDTHQEEEESEEVIPEIITTYGEDGEELDYGFNILKGDYFDEEPRLIPMDIAICPECEKELKDPENPRYRYPFISCKYCGPRYSIMTGLPYNREHTTMGLHRMCPDCRKEYMQMGGRRHLAETIGCRNCGPRLRFYRNRRVDEIQLTSDEIISEAIKSLKKGGVGAVKDICGFHLVFSAFDTEAVRKVRKFKGGVRYPMAVMFPDVEAIKKYCVVSEKEEELLTSNARPIVLLEKKKEYIEAEEHLQEIIAGKYASSYRAEDMLSPELTMGSDRIGAAIPSTALQILMTMDGGAFAFTSGNKTGEPIIATDDDMIRFLHEIDESEMKGIEILPDEKHIKRTEGMVEKDSSAENENIGDEKNYSDEDGDNTHIDFMLTNTLDIVVPMDDSIVQVTKVNVRNQVREVLQYIRRSRGYVPFPIVLEQETKGESFAAGGDSRTAFCLARKNYIYMSEYFGDLSSRMAVTARRDSITHLERMLSIRPQRVYTDIHSEYQSVIDGKTKVRETISPERRVELIQRQHHTSHILSVAAENDLKGRLLGIAFDGNGYGSDGTIWGSEIFSCLLNKTVDEEGADQDKTVELSPYILRSGAFFPIKMIEGDARTVLCCYLKAAEERQLVSMNGMEKILKTLGISRSDYALIAACLRADIGIYYSDSIGKLFEAASALLGICAEESYDGECAGMLESRARRELIRTGGTVMSRPSEDNMLHLGDKEALKMHFTEPHDPDEIFRLDQTQLIVALMEKYIYLVEAVSSEEEKQRGVDILALEFHRAIVDATVEVCDEICGRDYIQHIALSGGAMYNRLLLDGIVGSLERLGYTTYLNKDIPAGNGGVALGQLYYMEVLGREDQEAVKEAQDM